MLKEERQQRILELLRRDGKVLASELSAVLGTSEDTIRRDLNELADALLLQRVHGGALPRSPASASYSERRQQAAEAKAAIAAAALQLIQPGQVILLDAGTTTEQVACRLPHDLRATIITPSPPIALALVDKPNLEVILLGGRLDRNSLAASGTVTVEALRAIHADLCLIGVCSLHAEIGISTGNMEEALAKRLMIANSAEVAALASAAKLGTAAPFVVAPISELTHLITDSDAPEETLRGFRERGITVIQG